MDCVDVCADEGFDFFDQDGDGSISTAELSKMSLELGLGLTENECSELYAELTGGIFAGAGINREKWIQALALSDAKQVRKHLHTVTCRIFSCMPLGLYAVQTSMRCRQASLSWWST
jgi:hypothetical protein